jgi:hypothetical protein
MLMSLKGWSILNDLVMYVSFVICPNNMHAFSVQCDAMVSEFFVHSSGFANCNSEDFFPAVLSNAKYGRMRGCKFTSSAWLFNEC